MISATRARQLSRAATACAVAIAATLLCCRLAAAAPNFLWKATGPRGGTVYLAGSIHLLSREYYPLAPAFDEAFAASDLLVEEVDLGDMLAPESQMLMLTRGMMPASQTLESVVSPATMQGVREKVAQLGLPLAPLQLFKPWALALTLQGLEWQKAGFAGELGIDQHFYERAKSRGMGVKGLETVAFQVSRFDNMPMALQDRMLSETLRELETSSTQVEAMAQAWKSGDTPAIERLMLREFENEPEMRQHLLVERNQNWMPAIEALFARPAPAFVVVGAAHLIGADGLLAMLKARGYTIAQL